jgi:ribosomal protein L19E
MALREYFKKNIMRDISIGTDTKIIGSFSRNYVYPTDIDLYSLIERNDYDMLMRTITKKHKDVIFLYLTLFTDPYKNIDIEVLDKNDFSNIDFKNIRKELINLHNKKILDQSTYDKLIKYVDNPTLENVLNLELEINTKTKIKWFIHDIEKGFKIINDVKYNFKEMFEAENKEAVPPKRSNGISYILHWLWSQHDTFFIIDIGEINKSRINCYVRRSKRVYSFYKDMYVLYYANDYYYLLKSLIYASIHEKNFAFVNKIHQILEKDYGIHKQAFNKLYEINKLKGEDFKDLHLNNILEKALQTVKNDLEKVGFKYNDALSIMDNRQNLIDFTNKSIKQYYNKYRKMLVDMHPALNNMMPGFT